MIVVSINQSERQLASSKSRDKAGSLRSKSRSPDRKHTPGPGSLSSHLRVSAPAIPKPTKPPPPPACRFRTKPLRRPHTSACPRDTSNLPFHSEFELKEKSTNTGDRVLPPNRPLSKNTSSVRPVSRDPHIPAKARTIIHHDGNNHIIFQPISLDHVRDWEEELVRIELRSRRSTADMLGFRKR